jgi:hypothetical protein
VYRFLPRRGFSGIRRRRDAHVRSPAHGGYAERGKPHCDRCEMKKGCDPETQEHPFSIVPSGRFELPTCGLGRRVRPKNLRNPNPIEGFLCHS